MDIFNLCKYVIVRDDGETRQWGIDVGPGVGSILHVLAPLPKGTIRCL